ncbi:MAG: hypothetical protein ACI8RZ_003994 [Myxococcota bacterium]|jgi:hypothetical protein
MRFAWLREHSPDYPRVRQGLRQPRGIVRLLYNAAFWVFLVPFFTMFEYGTGFIAFTVVITFRFAANLYTNNVLDLTPEEHERYAFRI